MSAALCRNGHLISFEVIDPVRRHVHGGPWDADYLQPFCGDCGSSVLTQCESRKAPIELMSYDSMRIGSFCIGCGNPYPSATREIDWQAPRAVNPST